MVLASGLRVIAASCCAFLWAGRPHLRQAASTAPPSSRLEFPCAKFLVGVVKCGKGFELQFLGAGTFGATWVGEDAHSDEKVVIKLFANDGAYLTGANVPHLDKLAHLHRSEARNECPPAREVHEPAQDGSVREGAQRIRRCLADNFGQASKAELLYVKLKYAGDQLLPDYVAKKLGDGTWTVGLARKVLKQIFEGLQALASIHWVHHDLHPSNVVVQEKEGEPLVQIIDFGNSIRGEKGHECDYWPLCNPDWAPPEAEDGERVCPDPIEPDNYPLPTAFDPDFPYAFDAYSAGLIMVNLLFNLPIGALFATMYQAQLAEASYSDDYHCDMLMELARALGDRSKEVEAWAEAMNDRFRDSPSAPFGKVDFKKRLPELQAPAAVGFLELAAGLLRNAPKDRPRVSQLLSTEWMRDTAVAANPGA